MGASRKSPAKAERAGASLRQLTFRPLTKDLWPDLEALFGKSGACAGCWCMYWRLARGEWARTKGAENKARFRRLVAEGPPPGLLAFDGDTAVGWVAVGPREDYPGLDRSRFVKRVDDESVWSITCFYIKSGHRGRGVMSALIAAAADFAARAGASLVEAYPFETAEKRAAPTVYTGTIGPFWRAGFKTVARRVAHRPIVRKSVAGNNVAGKKTSRQ